MSSKKKKPGSKEDTLIVGIGASAGGLDALKAFFDSLPEETGMAFIVIIHLSPEHKSNMAELLQMQTALEVLQVNEKVDIKPEHVYVIPPNKLLKVGDNHLELSKPNKKHRLATIDMFFRSLAETKQGHAASIILSGTGSDGTAGMKAVKEHGGLTIAQEPEEAQYRGMPQSAIDSGVADMILPVAKIVQNLLEYKENLYKIDIGKNDEKVRNDILQQIFTEVRTQTGHDFSNYKQSSVLRRIKRRMQITHVTKFDAYLSYLKEHPDEATELFKDLLISVTNFFRDPKTFEALEEKVIPKLFEEKASDDQLRVWVPGCATGEEAYSIAILLHEYMQQLNRSPEVKVFATDIDEAALKVARKGRYLESISADVSSKRINRYFNKKGPEYEVKKEIREMILFAPHDLLRDPPFSKLDMVVCRNLLIYLNRALQSEVFNLFHYTLRDNGYLFLGLSDSNLEASDLFTAVDKKNRLYRRVAAAKSNQQLPQAPLRLDQTPDALMNMMQHTSHKPSDFEALHRMLLTRMYAPESVIINDNFQIVHATDNIKKFLEYPGGEPTHEILEIVSPPLRQPLRSLLFKLEQNEAPPLRKKVQLVDKVLPGQVEIIVHPISESNFSKGLIQVVFKETERSSKGFIETKKDHKTEGEGENQKLIESLEEELEYTKEQLQITVEEYETSNEELRASNEELQSMNQELQATTEELETSGEELQSVNEELKNKVDKLDRLNSDLKNLMEASQIGIVFIDRSFCVQRFTSAATDIFNLISSDKGRPLKHVTHNLRYEGLMKDVNEVLDKLKRIKKVVCSEDDRWFIMRMCPYRSIEDKIEGVVLSFVEFTELKGVRQVAQDQPRQEALATLGVYALEKQDLEAIMQRAIDLSCIILDLDCSVIFMLNKDHGTLEVGAHAGCAQQNEPIAVGEEWDIGYAINKNEPTVVMNYEKEDRFAISPFLEEQKVVSSINVVVRGTEETYGLLGFYKRETRQFGEEEIHFIQVVANIIGMAIERKYTKKALQNEIKQSKQYQREILNNNIADRWELGSYLHDNLAQTLVSVKIMMSELRKKLSDDAGDDISRIDKFIDEGISDIRDLTHDIIPIDIEEEGVAHAFRLLMRQTQRLHKVHCILETGEVIHEIKNIQRATNLYHVIQEAVKNAALHGHADNINVSFTKRDEHLLLQIKDDGIGVFHSSDESNGRGLRIMKYRMELVEGTFDIKDLADSGGNGTVVTCTIPLEYLTED